MVSGFILQGSDEDYKRDWALRTPQFLAYSREKRMLEKRIQYLRVLGYADDSPKLVNRLARLNDLSRRLIPNGEKGRFPARKLPCHCIW